MPEIEWAEVERHLPPDLQKKTLLLVRRRRRVLFHLLRVRVEALLGLSRSPTPLRYHREHDFVKVQMPIFVTRGRKWMFIARTVDGSLGWLYSTPSSFGVPHDGVWEQVDDKQWVWRKAKVKWHEGGADADAAREYLMSR